MPPKTDNSKQTNSKHIPVPPFNLEETSYEAWRRDIKRWCIISKHQDTEKAVHIHFALSGRAKNASDLMPNTELMAENGVDLLLEKLDAIYMPNKHARKFHIFTELYTLRKDQTANMHDYICDFQHTYDKFVQEGGTVEDTVLAYMLLASCKLPEEKEQLVRTGLIDDFSYDNMVSNLKRILGDGIKKPEQSTSEIGEQVFYSGEPSRNGETLYAVGRGRRPYRGRGGFTPRHNSRSQSRRRPRHTMERGSGRSDKRKLNPIGRDGKTSACMVCRSIYHYANECPDQPNRNNNTNDNQKSYEVNFNLFVGCTTGKSNKLSELTEECNGYAVLDSGCSNTVCGEEWMSMFIKRLSDGERQRMVIVPSDQSFTFGDGRTVISKRKVTMPCWMGGVPGMITTDVVDCNIPLLLSRKSMKNTGMILNFKKDELTVNNRPMRLRVTKSGHYALPISL